MAAHRKILLLTHDGDHVGLKMTGLEIVSYVDDAMADERPFPMEFKPIGGGHDREGRTIIGDDEGA